jgi:hypothetical protein
MSNVLPRIPQRTACQRGTHSSTCFSTQQSSVQQITILNDNHFFLSYLYVYSSFLILSQANIFSCSTVPNSKHTKRATRLSTFCRSVYVSFEHTSRICTISPYYRAISITSDLSAHFVVSSLKNKMSDIPDLGLII